MYRNKKVAKRPQKPTIQENTKKQKRSVRKGNKVSSFILFFIEPWGLSAPPQGGEPWGLSAPPQGGEPWGLSYLYSTDTFLYLDGEDSENPWGPICN